MITWIDGWCHTPTDERKIDQEITVSCILGGFKVASITNAHTRNGVRSLIPDHFEVYIHVPYIHRVNYYTNSIEKAKLLAALYIFEWISTLGIKAKSKVELIWDETFYRSQNRKNFGWYTWSGSLGGKVIATIRDRNEDLCSPSNYEMHITLPDKEKLNPDFFTSPLYVVHAKENAENAVNEWLTKAGLLL